MEQPDECHQCHDLEREHTQDKAKVEYDLAYRAAHHFLTARIPNPALRDILAESVTDFVIGKGGWGADRWSNLAADTPQKQHLLRALMRDLPESVVVSSGPLDDAITAAACALLAHTKRGNT